MPLRSIPVFCYHDVSPAGGLAPERFCEHLDAMQDTGYRTVTALQLYTAVLGGAPLPKRSVVLTFDDGHLSNFLRAAPELEKRGMTGVFFALTDFVIPGPIRTLDSAPADKPMPDCFRDALTISDYSQFINESEVAALLSAGHEVYAHGARHQGCFRTLHPLLTLASRRAHWASWGIYPRPMDCLPTFEVGSAYVYDGYWPQDDGRTPVMRRRSETERLTFCRRDFKRSLERIRELNGSDVQLFCWPWGQFDTSAEKELRTAGFQGAFTLERGPNTRGTSPFRLNRIGVAAGKDGRWIVSRLRMYSNSISAGICFKKLHKKPELRSVLLVTDSEKISGGSRQLINNAKALHDLGLDVSVAVPTASPIAEALPQGVRVERFDQFRKLFAAAAFLRRLCRDARVDVVHTFHNKAYKPAILARLWSGLTGRGFRLFINRGVIFKANMLFGLWARLASGMVVNSLACAESLRRLGVPVRRLNVVHNSFLPEGPTPPDRAARKKRGLRVLYLGNEAPAKGLDVFLDAVSSYCDRFDARDTEFVVAGARRLHPFLRRLAPDVAARVHDAGVLPHADVLETLAHADMLVISSRQESLPNVLLEAFHYGLPVVCTRVGGIPELVAEGQGGLLCAAEDAVCLAEKIRYLAENRDERLRMGLFNQKLVHERLDNRTKGLKLLAVYHGDFVTTAPKAPRRPKAD
ncbi:MAG: glycosyltransferase [Desulfovibrionaceae bacterium]